MNRMSSPYIKVLNISDIPEDHVLRHVLKQDLMDIFRRAKATNEIVHLLDGYEIGYNTTNSRGDDEFHIKKKSVMVMGLQTYKTAGFFIVEHGVNREEIPKEDVLFSLNEDLPQVPKHHYFQLRDLPPNVLAHGSSSSRRNRSRSRKNRSRKNRKGSYRKNRKNSRKNRFV